MILLLGASGLLGHNVLRLLLERGEAVRVLLRPGAGAGGSVPAEGSAAAGSVCTEPVPASREARMDAEAGTLPPAPTELASDLPSACPLPEVQYGNPLDDKTLLRAADGCSAIINCIGTTDMRLPRVEDFNPVNRDLPRLLCRVLEQTGIRTLVHTSTANTLAAGTKEHPTDESAPFAAPFCHAPYAISKKAGEDALLDWAATHPGHRIVIVCPGFMVGPYDTKPSSATLLLAAWRKPLMAGPRGGKSFLHVRDAATAIVHALEQGDSGRYLLTGESLTLKEFYALQARVCGYRQRFVSLPDGLVRLAGRLGDLLRAMGVRTMLCTRNTDQLLIEEWYDSGKADRELGLPHTPVADAIRDYFAWRDQR